MASEATSNATWKALSTLEWKKKQKKPAAASQNVGAILGEAADVVVGKYANSSGPNGSQYLNRLSEIQIQDEAYIHQQLVKEEVKPKRPPHKVFVGKGSRSSRGLKLSNSRKVRFNEGGDTSPTHKSAAAGSAAGSAAVGLAVVARAVGTNDPTAAAGAERRARFARTSSDSSTSSPPAAAAAAGACGVLKAGRRAGVSFETPASSTVSSNAVGGAPQRRLGGPLQAAAPETTADAAAPNQAEVAAAAAAGRSPSPMQQRPHALQVPVQQQQQQHMSTSSGAGHAVRTQPNSRTGSSTNSSRVQHAAAESAIMARFLQQQPGELDSPGSSGHGSNDGGAGCSSSAAGVFGGVRSASLELSGLQSAGRQGSGPALGVRTARRTTDLVDKQLQWLRDSTGSNGSSNSSSSSGGGGNGGGAPQGSAALLAIPGSSAGATGETQLATGYRPIAIPQELFDRWSTIGGPKPQSTVAAPAAASPPAPARVNGASSSGDSAAAAPASSNVKALAGRRDGSSSEAGAPSSNSSSRQGAGSPLGSVPSLGAETLGGSHLVSRAATGSSSLSKATTAAAAATAADAQWGRQEGTNATPSRRMSATNVLEGRPTGEAPRHGGLFAGRRTSSADSLNLLNLVSSIKPPASSSKPSKSPASAVPSSLAAACSLPSSGRASPAREPTSPRAYGLATSSHMGSAGGGISSNGTAGHLRRGSCDQLQAAAHSAAGPNGSYGDSSGAANVRGARAAAALAAAAVSAGAGAASKSPAERRGSRATGSTSSSHGDEGERWELPAGRRSPSSSTAAAAAAAGPQHRGSSTQAGLASAAAAGSICSRYGSSGGSSGSKAHLPDIGTKGPSGPQRR